MRYQALLTVRQSEIITLLEERIGTIPQLVREFDELAEFELDPRPGAESLYASLRVLEGRGLVIHNPGTWPVEWTATDDGLEARDLSENAVMTPSRNVAHV